MGRREGGERSLLKKHLKYQLLTAVKDHTERKGERAFAMTLVATGVVQQR